jgi:hypothetical protein
MDYKNLVTEHSRLLEKMESKEKVTVVINAFGGPGAGKSTASLGIAEELKKLGYVAEYIPEYAKELVWDENWDMLDGSEEHQFKILQEQMKRMDRLIGKVDFIITDAPILLNQIYHRELTLEYEQMLQELYNQYDNFNFIVQRDTNNFENIGRIHNLDESLSKDNEVKIMLDKYELYYGVYNHNSVNKVISNAIKTFKKRMSEKEAHLHEESYKAIVYLSTYGDKQEVFYGNSIQDILTILQNKNNNLNGESRYINVYIGELNTEKNMYENFAKYEIASGKNITPIYLNIPHISDRKEFKALAKTLSDNGAKYNKFKNKFYITRDCDLNKFAEFLPVTGYYAEQEAYRQQSRNELDYRIFVGSEMYDNRATIYYNSDEESIDIYGDNYGVHFPTLSEGETKEIIERFVLPDLKDVKKSNEEIVEYNGKMYSTGQYEVIKRAIKYLMTYEQIEVFADPELKNDLMEELRFALKDGLKIDQVIYIKNSCTEQWQMDFMRYGLQHGVPVEKLQPIIQDTNFDAMKDWTTKRNEIDKLKKELSKKPSILLKIENKKKMLPLEEKSVRAREHESVK